ncbi:unnamed protein product [Porites lobata]|uniref:Uncharacterized protein n=1 Tax=Porites lobata TaxID=104759 RepID=A0ABN8QQM6_9CNID|nr:unnamed protein product [Porites lobata]
MSADKVELFDDQDLNSIPPADKVKDMDKFLNSIPVTSNSDLSPGQQEPIYSSTQLNGAQPTFSLPRVENGVHSTLSPSATPFQPHSVVLEKCMDKLVETSSMLVAATMEQNLYISGKPKQVVDQYMLIGTEDAYQSARKLLKERYEQEGGSDHAMIVPVWVRQVSQPSKEVLQYAVLDDQSNVSFVSQSLCEKLDLQGPPTDLLLTTVQERNVHVPSNRICGVEVLDFRRSML